ncbi:MAG: hypothetical protein RL266_596 [Bacteroidota bacterium]
MSLLADATQKWYTAENAIKLANSIVVGSVLYAACSDGKVVVANTKRS